MQSLKSFFSPEEIAGIAPISAAPKSELPPFIPAPEVSTPIRAMTYYDQRTNVDYTKFIPWRRTFLGM